MPVKGCTLVTAGRHKKHTPPPPNPHYNSTHFQTLLHSHLRHQGALTVPTPWGQDHPLPGKGGGAYCPLTQGHHYSSSPCATDSEGLGPVALTVGVVRTSPKFVKIIPDKLCERILAGINKPFTQDPNSYFFQD